MLLDSVYIFIVLSMMVPIKPQTYQFFYLKIHKQQLEERYIDTRNIKVVRRAIEAFNTCDTRKIHEFISVDYINRESQSAKVSHRPKLRGSEEFVDTIKNLRSAFPDLHYEEREIISQGNKVIFGGNVNLSKNTLIYHV